MQCQPARNVTGHGLQETRLDGIALIAHAGPNAVAAVQQVPDHPAADEPGCAGNGDGATSWNRCHVQTSLFVLCGKLASLSARETADDRAEIKAP